MKFLLAKLLYSEEGLFIDEYLCLYEVFFDLTEMRDPLFLEKNGVHLEKVGLILSGMSDSKSFPVHFSDEAKNLLRRVVGDFIPGPREYFGLAGQRDLRQCFRVQLNDSLIPKPPRPVRYIGVGYKDKGSRRDPAFDGTLRWQEYARTFANLEREAEELDSSIFESPEDLE